MNAIQGILGGLQPSQCTRILNSSSGGCLILYLAIKQRRYRISRYLVHLSLRQGKREMCEVWRKSRHPLSAALEIRDIRFVELIARNLFDINQHFYDSFTPLTLAVSTGILEHVILMIQLGADINVPDLYGMSPLMTSFNITLSRFLIIHNANVNHQDREGDTALHFAVEEKSYRDLKFLVNNGADLHIRNKNGLTPLLMASAHLNTQAFSFLSLQDAYSQLEKIEALEVLGACCVCAQVQGISYWFSALQMRSDTYPKTGHSFPVQDILNLATEFTTSSELERLQHDPLLLAFQGILVIERILGRDNCVYLRCLLKTALIAKITHSGQLRPLIDYIKNICQTTSASSIAACENNIRTLFDRIAEEGPESFFENGGFEIFKLLANAAEKIGLHSPFSSQTFNENVAFLNVVDLLLYTMSDINKMDLPRQYRDQFKEVVKNVIKTDPRVKKKQSLLHRAMKLSHSRNVNSLHLFKLLLKCGADPDSQDYFYRTPIVYAYKFVRKTIFQKTVFLLAEEGSHLECMRNDIVPDIFYHPLRLPLNHRNPLSLRCLATEVIVNNEIPYKKYLPRLLVKFVELHI